MDLLENKKEFDFVFQKKIGECYFSIDIQGISQKIDIIPYDIDKNSFVLILFVPDNKKKYFIDLKYIFQKQEKEKSIFFYQYKKIFFSEIEKTEFDVAPKECF